MSGAVDLSFAALAPAGGEWSCLAYWVGPCDIGALRGVDAIGITRAMSYQYEVEDQADRTGTLIAEDADWREAFTPVAPVQLARAWSPLPYAVEVFGPPDWVSIEPDGMVRRAAACAWTSAGAGALATARGHSVDHERFRRLLTVALTRARDCNWGVLVAATPGWSYEHGHALSETTRSLMESVGFVVPDRHA